MSDEARWAYSAETAGYYEHWWLFINGVRQLLVVHRHPEMWTVERAPSHGSQEYGRIPYDTPTEELQALAVAMWRLA